MPSSLSLSDVGNKAAVFPLQLLGFDVDIINSVQFSNHTGYPFGFEGEVLDGSRLLKLIDGMERNGLLSSYSGNDCPGRIGNILTGYIGSESFLSAVVSVVKKLKGLNPKCRYVCDPVLGDNNKFYVPKELVGIYQRKVLPLADVITPNQFEIEQLTGITILSIQDAQRACCILHDMGVNLVLVTSIVFLDSYSNSQKEQNYERADDTEKQALTPPPDSIAMFASRRMFCLQSSLQQQSTSMDQSPMIQQENIDIKFNNSNDEQYIIYTPRFAGQFTGTGDLCAALFLGWTADENNQSGEDYDNFDDSLSSSLEKLAGTMHAIVKRTASSSRLDESARTASCRELQLIQSRDDILHPPRIFRALRVPAMHIEKSNHSDKNTTTKS
jgi:pyridoxine kinase